MHIKWAKEPMRNLGVSEANSSQPIYFFECPGSGRVGYLKGNFKKSDFKIKKIRIIIK